MDVNIKNKIRFEEKKWYVYLWDIRFIIPIGISIISLLFSMSCFTRFQPKLYVYKYGFLRDMVFNDKSLSSFPLVVSMIIVNPSSKTSVLEDITMKVKNVNTGQEINYKPYFKFDLEGWARKGLLPIHRNVESAFFVQEPIPERSSIVLTYQFYQKFTKPEEKYVATLLGDYDVSISLKFADKISKSLSFKVKFDDRAARFLWTANKDDFQKSGLDWDKVSEKLIKNNWATQIGPTTIFLTVNLKMEEKNMEKEFGDDFSKIKGFFQLENRPFWTYRPINYNDEAE